MSESEDFVYLDVRDLLGHYSNPTKTWEAKVRALARTQIELFKRNNLISKDAQALKVSIDDAVIRFSDLTSEGIAFLESGAVERWLAACDKKQALSAYEDIASLEKRLVKFRNQQSQIK